MAEHGGNGGHAWPTPTGAELVEWTRRAFPGCSAGTRAAHAVGQGVRGTFMPSEVVSDYCIAPMFNRGPVDVIARFSNGSGMAKRRDTDGDARGLAVKFFEGTDEETDLVAMTLLLFFVNQPGAFDPFTTASVPVPVADLEYSFMDKLKMALRVQPEPNPPDPGLVDALSPEKLVAYTRDHHEAKTAVAALGGLVKPVSYARATYHGVHTFMITAPDGRVRPVRYRWAPTLGVDGITTPKRMSSHTTISRRRLEARLARTTISFTLNFIVGESHDPIDDPTVPFPVNRPRISAGVLTSIAWSPTKNRVREADVQPDSCRPRLRRFRRPRF